ncbi:MAG: solute carrier family 23 protein [Cyanobacteriota/Melainabacteria group bacterium]
MASTETIVKEDSDIELQTEQEHPENGLKGLKHWRQDMFAGFIVALVSVPLSLGIAMASGAPPIAGLFSEIIAGLVFPFLGGAYVTISGPAAGLAPVLYSSIAALGRGNMEEGYHLVLGVILIAGLVQIALTYFKAARFSYIIPRSVVHGMLAAIGLLIVGKQIPNFFGYKSGAHEFLGYLAEIPTKLGVTNLSVVVTASICLALLFLLPKTRFKWIKWMPAHLAVVLTGIGLGQLLRLDHRFLVDIPSDPLKHGLIMPDFVALFSDPTLLPTIIIAVFALTIVDGTESLATIHAVDQIDPYKRKSNPHRTLFAMGISNICSAMVGGLTIIPGIIKSTTNIIAGGRTAWVNFYNAVFLILFLLVFNELIKMIPVATLAAVLIHIGYKLAGPHKWSHVSKLGWDQLLIFTTTVLVTVSSDLLVGIACGILAKVLILVFYSMKCSCKRPHGLLRSLWINSIKLFRNPIKEVLVAGDQVEITFKGSLTCFNHLVVRDTIDKHLRSSKVIRLNLCPSVGVVDHSSTTYLQMLADEAELSGLARVEVSGLERLSCCTADLSSLHYRPRPV